MAAKIALIVDDEATIRLYIKAVLQQNGFETIEAANGIEALIRNATTGVALLIADVQMPKMNGIELALAVGAEFPAIPVILVSGYCSRRSGRPGCSLHTEAVHSCNSARRDRQRDDTEEGAALRD